MNWFGFLKQQFQIASISGIPVRADLRWLVVVAVMAFITASGLMSSRLIDNFGVALGFGLVTTLVLFASVFLHEYAHAFVARRELVEVVEIVLHPFGGLARFRREPDSPRAEFRIAIAGPVASFLLALIFAGAGLALLAAEIRVLANISLFLGLWNFLIAVFNMLPGYPLDGGRVLRAYLWRRGTDLNEATLTTGRYGQIIGAALIVFGLVSLVLSSAGSFSGLWTMIVGIFLFDAARGIMRDINDFENMSVAEAMQIPVSVLPTDTVQKIVDHILPAHRRIALPVTVEKKLHGVLVLEDIRSLPTENWRNTTAGDVMRPVTTDHFVDSRMLLSDAKTLLRDNGIGALAVVNGNGDVVGYLQRGRLRKRT